MDLIKNQYIVCLQEIRQASKVLGFRSFTKTIVGEKDGGVSILVKNAIKSGVKKLSSYKMDDLLICKLKNLSLNLKMTFLLLTLISPRKTLRAKINVTEKR